jgi:hypothetical protein
MIINLIMALILMVSAFLTGGLGLGIIFIMEYFRKKIKENTGKENELLFIILGLIIYMIYQFWFYKIHLQLRKVITMTQKMTNSNIDKNTEKEAEEIFYSESNMKYLEKIITDIELGKAKLIEHDLIEE